MSDCRLARCIAPFVIGCLCLFLPRTITAQRPVRPNQQCLPEDCNGGGGGDPAWAVGVSAGTAGPTVAPNASGLQFNFTVTNYGPADTWSLTCLSIPGVVCSGVSQSSLWLPIGGSAVITVTYSVGNPGTDGSVGLRADAATHSTADGWVAVTVQIPSTAPGVAIAHNESVRDLGMCAASCFDKLFAHTTPAYFSLNTPRSFGLVYNSSTVKPTPVLLVDVTPPASGTVTSYKVEVRNASDNTLLTLLNGATAVYYSPGSGTRRLAAPIDWLANTFVGPGVLPVRVTVTANLSVGSPTYTTIATQLMAVSQVGSVFGNGVGAVPQMYTTGPGNYSMMFVEPDGSSSFYYRADAGSGYTTPAGQTLRVFRDGTGTWVRRMALDSSFQEFSWSTGRLNRAVDRFGNATSYYWTGALLDRIVDPMGKQFVLGYTGGKLATVSDPAGRITHYTVNGSGYLTTITDPDGIGTSLAYNAAGLLTTVTGRNGAAWSTGYDVLNRLQADTAPSIALYDGTVARPVATYTAADRIFWQPETAGTSTGTAKSSMPVDSAASSTTDPLGATVRFRADRFGAPIRIVDVMGKTTSITRDVMGRATAMFEPNGHSRSWVYSGALLIDAYDNTLGQSVIYQYNSRNDPSSIVGGPVRQDFSYHNGADSGRAGTLKGVFVGGSPTAAITYMTDELGRGTGTVDAAGHSTQKSYESVWGNTSQLVDERGNITRTHYDNLGRPDSLYLPIGAVTGTAYDVLNRVVLQRDPLNHLVSTSYDLGSTVHEIVDGKGQRYRFDYNALGALVLRHDLGDTTKADTLEYDRGGRLRKSITRRGNILEYAYNAAGQLTNRSANGAGVSSYIYDPSGRWMTAHNPAQNDSLAFDFAGRLTAWSQVEGGADYSWNYTYDGQSRLSGRSLSLNGVSQSAGYLSRSYSSYGQLNSTTAAGITIGFTRGTADSLPTVRTINPGSAGQWTITRVFDSKHQPTHDTLSVGALDNAFGNRIFYDSLNRLVRRDGNGSLTEQALYTFDAAGQLLTACKKVTGGCAGDYGVLASGTPAYTYDAAGNRTDPSALAVVGPANRVTSFKGYTVTYDADGNILTKAGHGKSWSYTWDALDRLTDVYESGMLQAHFAYDAFDRRIAKWNNNACSSERYVWDGDEFSFATDCYGNVKDEYGWYPGSDQPLGVKFAGRTGVTLADPRLGASVLGIADVDGRTNALIKAYNTTAWGESPADTGAMLRFRMAGQQYDQETGLYYMRARFYDPTLGRFLSEDPIGIDGGLNLYAYAANDPINRWDPTGEDPDIPSLTPDSLAGGTDSQHPSGCIPITVTFPEITIGSSSPLDPFSPPPWALGTSSAGDTEGGYRQVGRAGCQSNLTFIMCILGPTGANAAQEYAIHGNAPLEILKLSKELENVEGALEEGVSDLATAASRRGALSVVVRGFSVLVRIASTSMFIACVYCHIDAPHYGNTGA